VLDIILQRLAEFMEKSERLKRRIKGAMVYPIVVVGIASIILTGIMVFIIPKFEEIFKDFGVSLPGLTMWLIGTSRWFAGTKPGMFPGQGAVTFFIRRTKPGKSAIDWCLLKLPIFGPLVRKTVIARFTRTLGTLVAAGVPILEAIKITRDTCGNAVFERALDNVHNSIREGEGFAAPLRESKTCDGLVVNMIDVGEETGELDAMLMKIADNYDEEVDVAVASLVSLLEPLMVVFLGGFVGLIVVAMFLPLVKMIQSLQGG
jgi:type IV pilus assembly protein PilC